MELEKMILAVLIDLLDGCDTIEDLKTQVVNRTRAIEQAELDERLKRNPIGGKHASSN